MNLLSFPSCTSLCASKTSSALRKVQFQISARNSDITYIFDAFISEPRLMIGNALNYIFDSCQFPLTYLFSTPYFVEWTIISAVIWAKKSLIIFTSSFRLYSVILPLRLKFADKKLFKVTNLNEAFINFPFKCLNKKLLRLLQFSEEYTEKKCNQSSLHSYQQNRISPHNFSDPFFCRTRPQSGKIVHEI